MGRLLVRRLTRPKCAGQFDYELAPGASFTAIGLWNSQYLRCARCQKFASFRLTGPGTEVPTVAPHSPAVHSGEGSAGGSPPGPR